MTNFKGMTVAELIALLQKCSPDATVLLNVTGMESDGTIECIHQHQGSKQYDNFGDSYFPQEVMIYDAEPDWEEDWGEDGIKVVSRDGMFVQTKSPDLDSEALEQAHQDLIKEGFFDS